MVISHCDVATGKIYGCKKGSWKWWHEKGHIVFNSSPQGSNLLMIRSYIFDFWMLFIMAVIGMGKGYVFCVLLWLGYVGIGLYEEWWANQYANNHYGITKLPKKNRRKKKTWK